MRRLHAAGAQAKGRNANRVFWMPDHEDRAILLRQDARSPTVNPLASGWICMSTSALCKPRCGSPSANNRCLAFAISSPGAAVPLGLATRFGAVRPRRDCAGPERPDAEIASIPG